MFLVCLDSWPPASAVKGLIGESMYLAAVIDLIA